MQTLEAEYEDALQIEKDRLKVLESQYDARCASACKRAAAKVFSGIRARLMRMWVGAKLSVWQMEMQDHQARIKAKLRVASGAIYLNKRILAFGMKKTLLAWRLAASTATAKMRERELTTVLNERIVKMTSRALIRSVAALDLRQMSDTLTSWRLKLYPAKKYFEQMPQLEAALKAILHPLESILPL